MPELPSDPKLLAPLIDVSIPYAYALLGKSRPWTQELAIRAFRATGAKVGPIADATDAEIEVLARFPQRAA